jgi:hypothetical protein
MVKANGSGLVLRPGAAPGYCVGLITPASLAGAVYSHFAVRSTLAKLARPSAVRSTQFGGVEHGVLCVRAAVCNAPRIAGARYQEDVSSIQVAFSTLRPTSRAAMWGRRPAELDHPAVP